MTSQTISKLWTRTCAGICLATATFTLLASPARALQEPVALKVVDLEIALQKKDGKLPALVQQLEESISRSDSKVLMSCVDTKRLLDRATTVPGEIVADDLRRAFCDGTRDAWRNRSLAADYLGSLFRFLRPATLGGRSGLLFRASADNGVLNYYLYSMCRDTSGSYWVDDIFVVGLDEYVSDTLRRGYLTLVNSDGRSTEAGRIAQSYIKNIGTVMKMNSSLQLKDYPTVMSIAQTLPGALKSERGILLMRVEAAEHTSLAERSAVLTEWKNIYQDEMSLPLKFADWHTAQGHFGEAERILTSLATKLGGDPYLLTRIGENRLLQNRISESASAELKAASAETVELGIPVIK